MVARLKAQLSLHDPSKERLRAVERVLGAVPPQTADADLASDLDSGSEDDELIGEQRWAQAMLGFGQDVHSEKVTRPGAWPPAFWQVGPCASKWALLISTAGTCRGFLCAAQLRDARMRELQVAARQRAQLQAAGHGAVQHVPEGRLLREAEGCAGPLVCHLALSGSPLDDELDEHLASLAHRFLGTRFVRAAIRPASTLHLRLRMPPGPGKDLASLGLRKQLWKAVLRPPCCLVRRCLPAGCLPIHSCPTSQGAKSLRTTMVSPCTACRLAVLPKGQPGGRSRAGPLWRPRLHTGGGRGQVAATAVRAGSSARRQQRGSGGGSTSKRASGGAGRWGKYQRRGGGGGGGVAAALRGVWAAVPAPAYTLSVLGWGVRLWQRRRV